MIEYKHSEFDSEILGVRAGNLIADGYLQERSGMVYEAMARAAFDFANFIHFRVDTRNLGLVAEAEGMGFRIMDTLLHVGCSLEELPIFFPSTDLHIRTATKEDMPMLEHLTRDNMRFTRFHNDPNVTMTKADAFYCKWICNVVLGNTLPEYGVEVRVATIDDKVIGYMSTMQRGDVARYGTMSVSPDHKRKGVASNLAYDALVQSKMRGAKSLEGGALLRAPVLNLYMNLGLRHTRSEHSLHWWGGR